MVQKTTAGMYLAQPHIVAQLTLRRAILKKYVPSFVFFLFNVTFISFIQSVLLYAFSGVPAYAILVSTQFEPNVTAADIAYFAVELSLVLSEYFSDGQQWGLCS